MPTFSDIVALITGSVLFIWLLLSLLNQFADGRYLGRLREFDFGALIPSFTFFAPRPGVSDQVLIVRYLTSDGFTSWRTVSYFAPSSLLHAIWNPQKRIQKLISDCIAVISAYPQEDSSNIVLSKEYLILQFLAEQHARDFRSIALQFALIDVDGFFQEPDISLRLISPIIPL